MTVVQDGLLVLLRKLNRTRSYLFQQFWKLRLFCQPHFHHGANQNCHANTRLRHDLAPVDGSAKAKSRTLNSYRWTSHCSRGSQHQSNHDSRLLNLAVVQSSHTDRTNHDLLAIQRFLLRYWDRYSGMPIRRRQRKLDVL